MTGSASLRSGRDWEGFLVLCGPVHLGLPSPALLFQGNAEKPRERGGKGHLKWLLSANRSHPARPPACQKGRKSNSGPRPESTAPLAGHSSGFWGHFPRIWVPLAPAGRREEDEGEDGAGAVHPVAFLGLVPAPPCVRMNHDL